MGLSAAYTEIDADGAVLREDVHVVVSGVRRQTDLGDRRASTDRRNHIARSLRSVLDAEKDGDVAGAQGRVVLSVVVQHEFGVLLHGGDGVDGGETGCGGLEEDVETGRGEELRDHRDHLRVAPLLEEHEKQELDEEGGDACVDALLTVHVLNELRAHLLVLDPIQRREGAQLLFDEIRDFALRFARLPGPQQRHGGLILLLDNAHSSHQLHNRVQEGGDGSERHARGVVHVGEEGDEERRRVLAAQRGDEL